MKTLILNLFLFSVIWVSAQPALDGFMRGKKNLDIAASLTYETYGSYFSKMNNPVPVGRTAIPVSLYAAYGITDRLDVQASIPYVYTDAELSGMQDFSLYFKGSAFERSIKDGGHFKLMLSLGGKIPMSQYETQNVNSIGQADTAVDMRIILQLFKGNGFFVMMETGYTHRLEPVPSSYPLAFKVGWAKEKHYLEIWYDQQFAIGGNDYQDYKDGDFSLSFRTFGVSYGKLGVSYYRPFKNNRSGVSTGLSYVIWGRNIGQAVIASVGYVQRINFSKQ